MYVMLGIPNCDTIRKARKYFEANNIEYRFRDLRKEPLSAEEWRNLLAQDPDFKLINTRGPSFRKTGMKAADLTAETALNALLEAPTVMKRPAYLQDDTLKGVGFKEQPLFF